MAATLTASATITRALFERVFLRHLETDGHRKISAAELRLLMQTVGEDLKPEDAEYLVQSADSDNDGLVDFDDLFRMVGDKEEEEEDEGHLREAFKMYEMDGEGCITPKSLMRMLSRLGTAPDLEECRAMICSFDHDGDGVLNFDEFRGMMQN